MSILEIWEDKEARRRCEVLKHLIKHHIDKLKEKDPYKAESWETALFFAEHSFDQTERERKLKKLFDEGPGWY